MQIAPHIEAPLYGAAPLDNAQFTRFTELSPGVESPYSRKPDEYGGGTFAEMLEKMLRKSDAAPVEEPAANDSPPAETTGPDDDAAAVAAEKARAGNSEAESEPAGKVLPSRADGKVDSKANGKADSKVDGVAAGRSAAKTGQAAEDGEPELAEMELSNEEQHVLLSVERLINPPLEQISPEEEAWLTGEAAEDAALGAVFPLDGGMAAETLAAVPEADAGDAAAFRLDGPTLAEAGLPGEKPDGAETAAVRRTAARLAEDSANMDSLAEAAAAAAPPRPGPQKAAATAETAGKGRLDEARSRDKKRGASLEVRDLRTGPATDAAVRGDSLHLKAAAETRSPDSGAARGEISLELRLSSQAQDAPAVETAWETRSGQAFEDLLARELHQNFNNDIVRHASIALRDGGEGTIRLALKPESLGNVKIRLEMAENKITGHIIVESEEALRAFEREIGSLEQAFKDSGFDGANLEMSLAQDQWSADGSGAGQGWQEAEANRFLPDYGAASQYDAALERVDAPVIVDIYQRGAAAINMLV